MPFLRWARLVSLSFIIVSTAPETALAVTPQDVCDRAYAKETLNSGDYAEFCNCTKVSDLFLRAIQSSNVFQDVLAETGGLCAPLASLLTDPVTATLAPGLDEPEPERRSNGPETRSRNARANTSSGGPTTDVGSRPTTQSASTTSPVNSTPSQASAAGQGEIYNGW